MPPPVPPGSVRSGAGSPPGSKVVRGVRVSPADISDRDRLKAKVALGLDLAHVPHDLNFRTKPSYRTPRYYPGKNGSDAVSKGQHSPGPIYDVGGMNDPRDIGSGKGCSYASIAPEPSRLHRPLGPQHPAAEAQFNSMGTHVQKQPFQPPEDLMGKGVAAATLGGVRPSKLRAHRSETRFTSPGQQRLLANGNSMSVLTFLHPARKDALVLLSASHNGLERTGGMVGMPENGGGASSPPMPVTGLQTVYLKSRKIADMFAEDGDGGSVAKGGSTSPSQGGAAATDDHLKSGGESGVGSGRGRKGAQSPSRPPVHRASMDEFRETNASQANQLQQQQQQHQAPLSIPVVSAGSQDDTDLSFQQRLSPPPQYLIQQQNLYQEGQETQYQHRRLPPALLHESEQAGAWAGGGALKGGGAGGLGSSKSMSHLSPGQHHGQPQQHGGSPASAFARSPVGGMRGSVSPGATVLASPAAQSRQQQLSKSRVGTGPNKMLTKARSLSTQPYRAGQFALYPYSNGVEDADEIGVSVWGSHVVVPVELESELDSEYAESVCTEDLEMEA